MWRIMALPILLHGGFDFFLILAASLMADDWPLVGVEVVVVAVAFSLLAAAIWREKRHISELPPLLPTAMDGGLMDEAAVAVVPSLLQPRVAMAEQGDAGQAYRQDHAVDAIV